LMHILVMHCRKTDALPPGLRGGRYICISDFLADTGGRFRCLRRMLSAAGSVDRVFEPPGGKDKTRGVCWPNLLLSDGVNIVHSCICLASIEIIQFFQATNYESLHFIYTFLSLTTCPYSFLLCHRNLGLGSPKAHLEALRPSSTLQQEIRRSEGRLRGLVVRDSLWACPYSQ
jgi:hypothetical protein